MTQSELRCIQFLHLIGCLYVCLKHIVIVLQCVCVYNYPSMCLLLLILFLSFSVTAFRGDSGLTSQEQVLR